MKEKLNQEYDTKISEQERIIDALNKQRRMREESDGECFDTAIFHFDFEHFAVLFQVLTFCICRLYTCAFCSYISTNMRVLAFL